MEAQDVLRNTRLGFDNESNDLIFGAVNPDLVANIDQDEVPQPPAKRLKADENASRRVTKFDEKDRELVHKRSSILQDRTNISPSCVASSGYKDAKPIDSPIRRRVLRAPRYSTSPSEKHDTRPDRSSPTKALREQSTSVREDLAPETPSGQQQRQAKGENADYGISEYRSSKAAQSPCPSRPAPRNFSMSRLPENVLKRIFHFALVRPEPIVIDVSKLRKVLQDHARTPTATQKLYHHGAIYLLPVLWKELDRQVDHMREGIGRSGLGLSSLPSDAGRPTRSTHRSLATSLLYVSRDCHNHAASIFYGSNTFDFPCATSAWMQLHAFLSTIGLRNVAHLQHIRIHVPLWHRGTQEDYIEGSLIDLFSSFSHLRQIKTSSRDRLLTAIQHTTHVLGTTTTNLTLSLTLENSIAADYWTGRHTNDKRLVSLSEAEAFVERRRKGIACLREMTEALAPSSAGDSGRARPLLTLLPALQSVQADKKEFRQRLVGLVEEAAKYGWEVDPVLGGARCPSS